MSNEAISGAVIYLLAVFVLKHVVVFAEQFQPFCIGNVLRILALNTELQSYYALELGFWVALLTLYIILALFRW